MFKYSADGSFDLNLDLKKVMKLTCLLHVVEAAQNTFEPKSSVVKMKLALYNSTVKLTLKMFYTI